MKRFIERFTAKKEIAYVDRVKGQNSDRPVSLEAFRELEGKLSQPLTEEAWGTEGTIEFVIDTADEGQIMLSIEYDSIETSELRKYLNVHKWTPDDDANDVVTVNTDNYRRIKSFCVLAEDNKIDLTEVANDVDVYVYVGSEPESEVLIKGNRYANALHSVNAEVILSKIAPTSLLGITLLLHEVGHRVKQNISSDKENQLSGVGNAAFARGNDVSKKAEAAYIREERSADAFALSVMRQFMRNSPELDNVRLFLAQNMAYHEIETDK